MISNDEIYYNIAMMNKHIFDTELAETPHKDEITHHFKNYQHNQPITTPKFFENYDVNVNKIAEHLLKLIGNPSQLSAKVANALNTAVAPKNENGPAASKNEEREVIYTSEEAKSKLTDIIGLFLGKDLKSKILEREYKDTYEDDIELESKVATEFIQCVGKKNMINASSEQSFFTDFERHMRRNPKYSSMKSLRTKGAHSKIYDNGDNGLIKIVVHSYNINGLTLKPLYDADESSNAFNAISEIIFNVILCQTVNECKHFSRVSDIYVVNAPINGEDAYGYKLCMVFEKFPFMLADVFDKKPHTKGLPITREGFDNIVRRLIKISHDIYSQLSLIHGDLKPENMMISTDDPVKYEEDDFELYYIDYGLSIINHPDKINTNNYHKQYSSSGTDISFFLMYCILFFRELRDHARFWLTKGLKYALLHQCPSRQIKRDELTYTKSRTIDYFKRKITESNKTLKEMYADKELDNGYVKILNEYLNEIAKKHLIRNIIYVNPFEHTNVYTTLTGINPNPYDAAGIMSRYGSSVSIGIWNVIRTDNRILPEIKITNSNRNNLPKITISNSDDNSLVEEIKLLDLPEEARPETPLPRQTMASRKLLHVPERPTKNNNHSIPKKEPEIPLAGPKNSLASSNGIASSGGGITFSKRRHGKKKSKKRKIKRRTTNIQSLRSKSISKRNKTKKHKRFFGKKRHTKVNK